MATSKLQATKNGRALFRYWATGEGFQRWAKAKHPWTTLKNLLLKESAEGGNPMSEREAEGLATNIMMSTPQGRALFQKGHSGHKSIGQRVAEGRRKK